jgi:hypothetical protein
VLFGTTGILVVAVASFFRLNRLLNGGVALDYARKRVGVVGPTRAELPEEGLIRD